LQALRPYCIAAVETSGHIAGLKAKHDSLEQALEASDQGVISVSADWQIMHITARARRLVEQSFGPSSLRSNALPDDLRIWVQNYSYGERRDTLPVRAHATTVVQNGRSLSARLIHDTHSGCLLILSARSPDALELCWSDHEAWAVNLTAREIDVLRWVEKGMGNADIAVLCGVSVRTVHKHLQHAFEKLNVENRMAAARKVRDVISAPRMVGDTAQCPTSTR
jgi:DNA-binding CsgD family transcriptional regulator